MPTPKLLTQQLFRPTEYYQPKTVREAVSLLKYTGSKPICGGTDIMVERDPKIAVLVDLSKLPLGYIKESSGHILIGATTTIRQIELSRLFLREPLNILHDAIRDFGTIQVKNMASIGGNLCNGIPSADTPPALIALDAKVTVSGPRGFRRFPLEKMYRHVRILRLRKGEILTEVRIPRQPAHTAAAYVRIVRSQVDIALVSAAVRITIDEQGKVEDCRIVLGAVAPTSLRARKAENFLRGMVIGKDIIAETGRKASQEARPISDVRASAEYRRAMVAVLVERAIRMATLRLGRVLN
ncbi:MAG: xanthine dehydrogenase family protein subunit M [Candidatus Bathyarchaeia archaeon]|jgi:carbon-monoxide dehydrogenase medium subunit